MASSIGEQIIQAVVAALEAGSPPGDVYRSRLDEITPPAFNVYPTAEKTSPGAEEELENVMTLRVVASVKASGEADAAADPLYVWAVQKVMADETLDGLAITTVPVQRQWILTGGDQDMLDLAIDFEITYYTDRADPTVSRA